jgi:hypothetical protein
MPGPLSIDDAIAATPPGDLDAATLDYELQHAEAVSGWVRQPLTAEDERRADAFAEAIANSAYTNYLRDFFGRDGANRLTPPQSGGAELTRPQPERSGVTVRGR